MAAEENPRIGRRVVLGAAIGGAAAVAAALVSPSTALGDNGDTMHVGEDHTGTATTSIQTTGGHAFFARTDSGDGLRGWSDSNNGSGVFGYATDPAGFGVYGKNGGRGVAALGSHGAALWAQQWSAPLALKIEGHAQFSRSGRVTIATGKRSATLPVGPVSAATFGIATVQQLRTDLYVQCVVHSGSNLKVYLNRAAPSATTVAWMAFEKP